MTTRLATARPVKRLSDEIVRERGRSRRIVVSLHPGGTIGFRLEKCRKEYRLSIVAAFRHAVQQEIAFQRAEKERKRREKSGGKYLAKRR